MEWLRKIGGGATCSVWLARRKGRLVVVKRIAAAHLRAGAEELAVLHQLRGDRGFVQLLHAELTPPELHLVLERCAGDLFARLRHQGSATLSQARLWLHPLAGALARLHQLGYIHGDVKPENVLLRRDGSVCLADFGLAAKALRGARGTHEYMAPELLAGRGDHRVDWWAFGVLAYELVQGAPPWVHAEEATLKRMIAAADVAYTPRMPHMFRLFLEGLLQPKPRNRLQAARVLAHGFFRDAPARATALERAAPAPHSHLPHSPSIPHRQKLKEKPPPLQHVEGELGRAAVRADCVDERDALLNPAPWRT